MLWTWVETLEATCEAPLDAPPAVCEAEPGRGRRLRRDARLRALGRAAGGGAGASLAVLPPATIPRADISLSSPLSSPTTLGRVVAADLGLLDQRAHLGRAAPSGPWWRRRAGPRPPAGRALAALRDARTWSTRRSRRSLLRAAPAAPASDSVACDWTWPSALWPPLTPFCTALLACVVIGWICEIAPGSVDLIAVRRLLALGLERRADLRALALDARRRPARPAT